MSPASSIPPPQSFPGDCPSAGSSLCCRASRSAPASCHVGHPCCLPQARWGTTRGLGLTVCHEAPPPRTSSTVPTRHSTTSLLFVGQSHPEELLASAGAPWPPSKSIRIICPPPQFLLLYLLAPTLLSNLGLVTTLCSATACPGRMEAWDRNQVTAAITYCPLPQKQRRQEVTWSVAKPASPGTCLVAKGEPHFPHPHHPNIEVDAL